MFNLRLKRERMELHASDVPDFVTSRLANTAESEKRRLKSAIEEIKKEFYNLKILVAELGEKNVAHAFSNTVKDNFVSRSARIIDNVVFEIEKSISYSSIKNCAELISISLDDMSNLKVKELRHLYAFKSDMDRISNQVKLIMRKHKDFKALFQSCSALADINSIETMAGVVHESLARVDSLGNEVDTLNDRILDLQKRIEKEKSELREMEADPSRENAEKELKSLEKEKSAIRQRIATELGGIERVLKKFMHSGAEMSADELALAEQYTKSPEDAFINDRNLIIKKILYEIIALNVLDKKEKEKAADMIRTASILVSLRNEYVEMSKKSESLMNDERISRLITEAHEHKEKLKGLEKNLSSINNELDRKIHEKTKIEMEIMKTRKILESMLTKNLGIEITIKLN